MGSLHNDLHSWAGKARRDGNETIVLDVGTVDKIVEALAPSPADLSRGDDDDRMTPIDDLISELQGIRSKFGNTCVYLRRGGMSWGAVALNRRADDEKNGVFDLQAQHDKDMLALIDRIERLKADRDELRAALTTEGQL